MSDCEVCKKKDKAIGLVLNRIGREIDGAFFQSFGPVLRIGLLVTEFRRFWWKNDLEKYVKDFSQEREK